MQVELHHAERDGFSRIILLEGPRWIAIQARGETLQVEMHTGASGIDAVIRWPDLTFDELATRLFPDHDAAREEMRAAKREVFSAPVALVRRGHLRHTILLTHPAPTRLDVTPAEFNAAKTALECAGYRVEERP